MNILKSSDPQVAHRFVQLILNLGFTRFNVGKFLAENAVDIPVDECLENVLQLTKDEAVELLTPYGESSDMYRHETQLTLANQLHAELCYTPYVAEEPKRPSPIYPQWRGHKVKNKKRGW